MAALLDPVADRYDLAILDCAPGMTLTSESVFAAVDALLVPTVPTTLSKRTLQQLADFLAESEDRPLVLPFASMVDRRKKLHVEITEKLAAERSEVARTVIPSLAIIETMSVRRSPVTVFAPNSSAAKAYRALWSEIRCRGA